MARRKKNDVFKELLGSEPSMKNYFLDKGFSDLGATIRNSFELNKKTAQDNRRAITNCTGGLFKRLANAALRVVAIIATYIFGTIITVLLSFFHSLVIAVIMACVYICLGLSKLVDSAYISSHRIAVVCDRCKVRSDLPGYKCPVCGKVHYCLRPNVYGSFTHRCDCGQKLPATCFTRTKNKSTGDKYRRKELEAVCANKDCQTPVFAQGSRPFCVTIVGGSSVGKTAYLTAASYRLIEHILPKNGCTVTLYNLEKEGKFSEVTSDYKFGRTSKTIEPRSTSRPSAFSLSFFIEHPGLRPKRLVHMFDIAGETFVGNKEHEAQRQYRYADGAILIVDPFGLSRMREEHEDKLSDVDRKNIGLEDYDKILQSLRTKIRHVSSLKRGQKIDLPLAVVVNKIDEPGVGSFFSAENRNSFKSAHPDASETDLDDMMCRQFLVDKGAGNFVNSLKLEFEQVRFFSCSAIGHTLEAGPYQPQGVIEPIAWIASLSDKALEKLLVE